VLGRRDRAVGHRPLPFRGGRRPEPGEDGGEGIRALRGPARHERDGAIPPGGDVVVALAPVPHRRFATGHLDPPCGRLPHLLVEVEPAVRGHPRDQELAAVAHERHLAAVGLPVVDARDAPPVQQEPRRGTRTSGRGLRRHLPVRAPAQHDDDGDGRRDGGRHEQRGRRDPAAPARERPGADACDRVGLERLDRRREAADRIELTHGTPP
jgi:hypothetical protein